ncbi:MAG: stage sporulation protein [Paenibacillus sp.]|jgi:stage II sporulation protein P|nr:stage sporulation protein [Paenibacillus sp.]
MRNSGWLSGINGYWRAGGGVRSAFGTFVLFTFILFILLGLLGIWLANDSGRASFAMQRLAASVAQPFFIDMVSLEVPHLQQERKGSSTFAGKRVIGYLSGFWLHVNPIRPDSLLAGELRWLGRDPDSPDKEVKGSLAFADGPSPAPSISPDKETDMPIQSAQPTEQIIDTSTVIPGPTPPLEVDSKPVTGSISKLATQGKAVLIYHSHPRESWVSELQAKSVSEAENADKNITLVGKRLAEQLERAGVGAVHSNKDYKNEVPGYNWNFSYKYSLQTVQEAFAVHENLKFLFDLHRDSAARSITTASINGLDYAKVYFIVGKKNENWEQNEAFAKQIHDRLQSEYPGISRGILDKGSSGHGEYNQSISPSSMLIEVGGAYNSLEESYRTADVLAKVIADLFWNAEKVNGTVSAAAANSGTGTSS